MGTRLPYHELVVREVVILAFPPTDAVFGQAARRVAAELPEPTPAALQAALRHAYPRAVVRARDPLASFGAPAWYVYRDGRFSPFVPAAARWWDDPATARIVIGDDGAYLDASPAALELLGVDVAGLRAARSGDFTVPAYRAMLPWIRQLLRDTGSLHSTSVLQRPDGAELPVEFRFARDADGPGRHVAWVRPVPPDAVDVVLDTVTPGD